jgi:hypothetical protein
MASGCRLRPTGGSSPQLALAPGERFLESSPVQAASLSSAVCSSFICGHR